MVRKHDRVRSSVVEWANVSHGQARIYRVQLQVQLGERSSLEGRRPGRGSGHPDSKCRLLRISTIAPPTASSTTTSTAATATTPGAATATASSLVHKHLLQSAVVT